MRLKQVVCTLVTILFDIPRVGHKLETCWSGDMLNFDVLKKGLELVSLLHYLNNFWTKIFFCLP